MLLPADSVSRPTGKTITLLSAAWWVAFAMTSLDPGSSCNITWGVLVAVPLLVLTIPLALATVMLRRKYGSRKKALLALCLSPALLAGAAVLMEIIFALTRQGAG